MLWLMATAAVTSVSHELRNIEHHRACPTDDQTTQAHIWLLPGVFGTAFLAQKSSHPQLTWTLD